MIKMPIGPYRFAVLLAALFCLGCAGSHRDDPAVLMRSQRVQAAIVDVVSALQNYHGEKGFFPQGLATLREGHYLTMMPDLEREWTFEYFTDGDKVSLVQATSTETMINGAGYKIAFRVADNAWEGYGITVWPK